MSMDAMLNEIVFEANVLLDLLWAYHVDSILLLLALAFICLRTPALTWITHLISGKPLNVLLDRNNRVIFAGGNYKAENMEIKKRGTYETRPEGTYRLPYGLFGGIYVSDKATPLSPAFLASSQHLIDKNFENYTQAEIASKLRVYGDIIKKLEADPPEVKFEELDDATKRELVKITNSPQYLEVREKELSPKMGNKWLYLDFALIRNYFRYSSTPSSVQKIIDYEKANAVQKANTGFKVTMDHVIALAIILIVAAIAYYIITSGAGAGMAKSAASAIPNSKGGTGISII